MKSNYSYVSKRSVGAQSKKLKKVICCEMNGVRLKILSMLLNRFGWFSYMQSTKNAKTPSN